MYAAARNTPIGLLQLTITWYKSAMLEGKLIIISPLGHQNKGKSSFTGSGLVAKGLLLAVFLG